MPQYHIVIVAAGRGTRLGGDTPKQFQLLDGKPMLAHTLQAMHDALPEAPITLVLSPYEQEHWLRLRDTYSITIPHNIVSGGETRWESVRNAIASLNAASPSTIILIHDGARPLTPTNVTLKAAQYALNTDGAIPAISVSDSLRQLQDDRVSSVPVDRSDFRAIQTPQAFALWRLREAYEQPYREEFTDDASVLAAAGYGNIVMTPGDSQNIKITTPIDMLLAEVIIKSRH